MGIEKIFYLIIVVLLVTIQFSLIYLLRIKDIITFKLEQFEESQVQNLKKYNRRVELLDESIQPVLTEIEVKLNEIKED